MLLMVRGRISFISLTFCAGRRQFSSKAKSTGKVTHLSGLSTITLIKDQNEFGVRTYVPEQVFMVLVLNQESIFLRYRFTILNFPYVLFVFVQVSFGAIAIAIL